MDGIYLFSVNSGSAFSNTNIYNNTITSDMCNISTINCTAPIFLTGTFSATHIFNNIIYQTTSQYGPESLIRLSPYSGTENFATILVANNTLVSTSGNTNGVKMDDGGNLAAYLTLENNIITETGQAILSNPNDFDFLTLSNYNDFYANSNIAAKNASAGPGVYYSTLANWQALGAIYDPNSSSGNPLLTNYIPQTGSAAIGLGTNLTSLCSGGEAALCSDAAGNARPTGSTAWTAGALNASGSSGPPLPPTGLTATVSP